MMDDSTLQQEKTDYERIMGQDITWQDVVNACDELIATLGQKMREEPQHGQYWQERMAVTMRKKQEALIMQQAEKQEFMKSIGRICINVLEKSRGAP